MPVKIGYNAVFGYYLEVTNQYAQKVPSDYRAVATLKDRQRFTRADLRDKEREVLLADAGAQKREYAVFVELRESLARHTERLQLLAGALAELDVLSSLAEIASDRGYVKPTLTQTGDTVVTEARHPVVELALPQRSSFVPNDLKIGDSSRFTLLTGPNMSGKSTYLRQTALLSIMTQIGSFVPARSAQIRVHDRIYTRIGASDDLAGGASTFMVEMRELARILHGVTPNSLVILDEIGRGTSTFDGLAIAWAASEFLIQTGATVLFATQLQIIQSTVPNGLELTIITAAVIGGVSILGGTGTVIGSTLAAILFAAIGSAMIFINVSAYWLRAVIGILILITVLADMLRRNREMQSAKR